MAPPPPAIRSARAAGPCPVNATVSDGIATTRVTQEVQNPTERPQEATYLLPLPVHAAVSDFALWVDGERWDAELLPSADARRLYETSSASGATRTPGVRRPGVFRARIFPVPRAAVGRLRWSTLRH